MCTPLRCFMSLLLFMFFISIVLSPTLLLGSFCDYNSFAVFAHNCWFQKMWNEGHCQSITYVG